MTWYTPNPQIDSSDPNSIVLVRNGAAGDRYYWEGSGLSRNWYTEASINYQRDFGKHHTSALVLYNQSKTYYPKDKNGNPTIYTEIPTGYVGLVGRVTYDYNTTYLCEFNVGYNGSENFAPDKRYGIFPALSMGWVITQEKFMKDISVINYMKLRASYGVVGNDKIDQRFLYLPDAYYSGGGYNFGSGSSRFWSNGYYEGASGNPDVSWEKSYKKNIGLDFATFKNRLIANIDVFWEKRTGILAYPQTYPTYTGLQLPAVNLGEVSNKGIEVLLKWNDKIGEVNYYANLNISYAKNNIDFMDEVPSNYPYTLKTGHPVGQPFGLKVRGFYYNGMPNVADQSFQLREGDVVYEDLNGDGKITNEDMTALGYPNYPLLNGGLTLGIKWKGWDVSVLIIGATMTSRYLQETFRTPFGSKLDGPVMLSQYENRWTPETRNTATLPLMTFTGISNDYKDSELWLKDASYARLKNVQLSYTFSNSFTKRIGISSLKPFASAYNLFTLDKIKFIDPESPTSDRPTYPLMLVMNVGLNINF
jgi:TonB-linked SusC/RagA family outer membrane protein